MDHRWSISENGSRLQGSLLVNGIQNTCCNSCGKCCVLFPPRQAHIKDMLKIVYRLRSSIWMAWKSVSIDKSITCTILYFMHYAYRVFHNTFIVVCTSNWTSTRTYNERIRICNKRRTHWSWSQVNSYKYSMLPIVNHMCTEMSSHCKSIFESHQCRCGEIK